MKTALYTYSSADFSKHAKSDELIANNVQLVLAFGAKYLLKTKGIYAKLRSMFPNAAIATCSTAGEIYHNAVFDNTVSVVAIEFEKTTVSSIQVNINDYANSFDAGVALLEKLKTDDLCSVLVLSDGNHVNGSELVRGINSVAGNIPVSGGLAGDATNFESTLTGLNQEPAEGNIIGIGLHGKDLLVSYGTKGGWDMFGLERTVTKSVGNQLFEIDGRNALELYKTYLGEYSANLPGSALLFPLSVIIEGSSEPIVRTILKIEEETGSMIFAGDIPQGASVRFMRANFDRIVDAATTAAENAATSSIELSSPPKLALLISCVGRKVILGSRTEEEVEAVDATFWGNTLLTGFYSYGEISPFNEQAKCDLHNQTMTITTFTER